MIKESPKNTFHVAFYPAPSKMVKNPYWSMLISGLKDAGVIVEDVSPSLNFEWLFVNRKKIDIIHIHYVQSLYSNSGKTKARLIYVILLGFKLLMARLLGYRLIFTLHNLKPTTPLPPWWVDFLGHWIVVNLSNAVIVHCKEASRLLASTYGRESGVYIIEHPNYVGEYPNTISKNDARKKLQISDDQFVFLFFGGIRPNKGLETLVDAFKKLEGEGYRLIIAGYPGKEIDYLQSLRNSALIDERITFYPFYISEEEVQIFFNSCDVVVLPFSNILTSGSAILALSFSNPVIAPKMGCLPELLLPVAGWVYESENPEQLVEAMKRVTLYDIERFGINGFSKISECTVSRFVNQTCICYGFKN